MLHPLKKYLFLNEIKAKDFAEKINYSRMTITQICNCYHSPSKRLAVAIERETGGVVTINDLNEWYEMKKKQKVVATQPDLFDCENQK